jgi:hypothetical protein
MSDVLEAELDRPRTSVRRVLAVAAGAALALASLGACTSASSASSRSSTTASSATSGSSTSSAITVSITGGLETVAGDNGRPIVLVAGLLGVPPAVFRKAFSGVTPADPSIGPTKAEAQRNKAALLAVLGLYGITNDELDHASNTYRYNASAGQTWPHTAATASVIVSNGKVTSIKVNSGGSGYTSAPTITLSDGQMATATLEYGTDAATNGRITAITLT